MPHNLVASTSLTAFYPLSQKNKQNAKFDNPPDIKNCSFESLEFQD